LLSLALSTHRGQRNGFHASLGQHFSCLLLHGGHAERGAFVVAMASGSPTPDGRAWTNLPGQDGWCARGIKCCTLDRYCTTTIRGTAVGLSRSSGLSNAISFANADHAKSSFGTIASTAMRNNVGPDIPSCHRPP
jgi:hypothetical protein